MTFLFLPGPPGLHFHFLVDLSTLTVCPLYFTSLSSCSQLFCFCFFWLIFFPSFALQSSVSPIWIRCNSQSCCPRTLRERKGTFYPICSISATPHNGRRGTSQEQRASTALTLCDGRSLHLCATRRSCWGGRPPPGTAAVHPGTRWGRCFWEGRQWLADLAGGRTQKTPYMFTKMAAIND